MGDAAWEAFTSASSEPVTLSSRTVRPLPDDDRYDWPDEEVHHGIAGYEITVHGDDPHGAFVKCWGRSRAAVDGCLDRLMAFVERPTGTEELFPDG